MFALLTRLLRRGHAPGVPPAIPPDGAPELLGEAHADEPVPAPVPAPQTAPDNVVPFSPPESRYHRIHPQTMALVEEMQSYAGFVEIMQAHLTNVCGETQAAAEDILGQALNIEGSVSGLVRHVGDTMQSDRLVDASDAMHLSVETGRAMIAELIRQHAETQTEIRHSLDTVRALSNRMRSHLGEIEDVRRYTDLLAINARIRIAGLGKNTGLEVIAEEIRALATQTGRLASDLNHELTEMDLMISEDLIAKVSSQQRTDDARTEDLQRSFAKLAEHMNTLNQFQADLIREVQRRGEDMREPLNTLCGSIQFQDVARQQLEQVSRALSMISDHFVALSSAIIHDGAPPDSSIATCLSSILGSYVMEQQRAAHRGESAATAPKIELF
ncbi:methyl-accepting chemotaxis protein [Novosphingobium pokkalii]|uniref:Methyl-accepting transducer domain-containing protein n=1 Tax=Novosphingobium pokkalii TaxID=1770194 RepID=A0ABV7V2V2_9SPHN|nr:methyl-accepting chemotaxis protein [Novosphingobium pokkalii]GHC90628.1 chemotaxis protein [Novosphingobium pokkalii]